MPSKLRALHPFSIILIHIKKMMTINEKKEVLNKLTDTEFGDMFGRLLGNQGFSNIKNEETLLFVNNE